MFDADLDLSDVLAQLKRADVALTEFVAPLWPGVRLVSAWMEGEVRRFAVQGVPDEVGYHLLGTSEETAFLIRPAEPDEVRKYLHFLPKARVVLLEEGLAYPATFAEKLQGITGPRPILFAEGDALQEVQARFDGMNLFYDAPERTQADSLFGGLLSESSIFSPGELLGTPGAAPDEAAALVDELRTLPDKAIDYRLAAVLEAAGAELESWAATDGHYAVTWHAGADRRTSIITAAASPITSGICLPGAKGFDPGRLTRHLLEHALEGWGASFGQNMTY